MMNIIPKKKTEMLNKIQKETHAPSVFVINLKNGKDLVSKDLNGFSDPYVKFNLNGVKAKSKVQYKTLNPIWNETFTFHASDKDVIHIEIWDEDKFSTDDLMERFDIKLSDYNFQEKR